MAGMSFRDQVALFSGARLVISASGAFMANFLMMPNGSRVVLATSQANVDSVLPATIARIGGVRTIYVVGSPTVNLEQAKSLHDWKHSDFRVSLEDVVEAIHA
jgi:capsular polysaccharide biosynthesis protein